MDKSDLRQENLRLLKDKLRTAGEATKPQLASMTGLSAVTVGDIVKQLLARREIEECKLAPSTGGRPPRLYKLSPSPGLALACYVYAECLRPEIFVFVLNIQGEIVEQQVFAPDEKIIWETFITLLQPFIAKYPPIVTVILGVPHTFVPLGQQLAAKLERPVYEVSDIQAAVNGCMDKLGVPEGTVVGIRQLRNAPSAVGIWLNGTAYAGQGGMAGRMLRQGKLQWERNPVLKAAETTLDIIGLLNPHGIIIYDERLKQEDLVAIEYRLAVDIPADYMPQILLRSDWQEDYSQGIYNLAEKYLHNTAF